MKNINKAILFTIFLMWACGSEVAETNRTNDSIPQKNTIDTANNSNNGVLLDSNKGGDNTKNNSESQTLTDNQATNYTKPSDTTQSKNGSESNEISEATGKAKKDLVPMLPEMVKIKGGSFKMGSKDPEAKEDEENIHEVHVDEFFIGKFEVTVAQFKSFIDATSYQTEAERIGKSYIYTGSWKNMKGINWRHDARGNLRPASEYDHPVIHISWNDAMAYCKWLSEQTKKSYRLLTEAEWEFAARGGSQSKGFKYSGSNNIDESAWYIGSSQDKGTYPSGTKKPNEAGVYDLSGNVYEWCADWYDSEYYLNSPSHNPKGATSGISRVVRGGSWHDTAEKNRVGSRFNGNPSYCGYNIGFRVARSQ
jgi:formylglycine-generating enzyme required for sulfatase activity